MSKIKAIFFDNDGVLVDTEELYYDATRDALNSLGVELSRELHENINMSQGRSCFDLAEAQGVSAEAIEVARLKRNAIYLELLRSSGDLVIPGVEDVLKELRPSRVFGIVTSCMPEHFKLIHSRSGLLKYFDFVIGQGDYQRHKPHPEPYLKALERSGVGAGDALAVEDAGRGVDAAVAAGLRCVAIPRGISSSGDFSRAAARLEKIADLRLFIESLERFA